jgi:cell wall-associated protease
MASMCWKLPMSYTSRTLPSSGYLVRLSHRDELQPGDMLNKYDYHAAIFYKWANAEHTYYWTLEQSGGTGHAVMRLTPYPYWGHDDFFIYRHRNIREVNAYHNYIDEIAGADRYETAVAASKAVTSSAEATYAVVCSGENWPDALGGSALAGALGGPVLLTPSTWVPSVVTQELQRLGVQHVYLIGGEGALSAVVERKIDAVNGVTVERLGGSNRYETAALVASETVDAIVSGGGGYDGSSYLATGQAFPDALGAAAVAAYTGRPILLSEPNQMPSATARAIQSIEATMAYIAGGTGAVSSSVSANLTAWGVQDYERFAGSDRYSTSFRLAKHGIEEGMVWDNVAIATGMGFADALAGAVLQARTGSPLVLTRPNGLSSGADWAIRENPDVEKVRVMGGEGAVEPVVRRQIHWLYEEP